jgi:hypothetical protein
MAARAAIFGTILLAAAATGFAEAPVRRVPVHQQATPVKSAKRPAPLRATACLGVDQIGGAIVLSEREVELSLKDGSRWRMRLAQACPALGYYQGFYYRRARAGFLCAKHDAVIARSGGACPIAGFTRIAKPKRK